MSDHSTPKLDAFRSLVQQAQALHAELSTHDVAIRDRDAIKVRMGDCSDEGEARKLLGELTKAEEVVTIKGIRAPRLKADLSTLLTEAEKVCNAAHSEVSQALAGLPREAAEHFHQLLREVQCETERDKRRQVTEQAILGVGPLAMAERQQTNLSAARRSVELTSEPPEKRLEGLQSALTHLDRAHAAQADITAEAKRLAAACDAFLKVFSKR